MQSRTLSLTQVLVCGAAIVTLSMGIRHGFGLWLQPITQAQSWGRADFAFAMAVQNLAWGFFGIFAGMLADRFGAFRVIVAGALLYASGLLGNLCLALFKAATQFQVLPLQPALSCLSLLGVGLG